MIDTAPAAHVSDDARPATVSGRALGSGARRVLLALHITLTCVWLGALAVTMLLVGVQQVHPVAALRPGLDRAVLLVHDAPIVNASYGFVLTGLMFSLFTTWGAFRLWWVSLKWVLLAALGLALPLWVAPHVSAVSALSDAMSGEVAGQAADAGHAQAVMFASGLQAVVLLGIVAISVFTPWGPRPARPARPDPWTVDRGRAAPGTSACREQRQRIRRDRAALVAAVSAACRAGRAAVQGGRGRGAIAGGWRGLSVDEAELRLPRPGMAITLNGIAQGFAADRACEAMRAAGAVAGLMDVGELASLGWAPFGGPWPVALQVPHHGREERIALDAGVATSTDSPSHFSADRRHHHIFDPRSGWSLTALSAVSVVAATATQADAWSTAIMVNAPIRKGHRRIASR